MFLLIMVDSKSFLSVSTFKLIFTTQISDRADIVFGDSQNTKVLQKVLNVYYLLEESILINSGL